MQSPAVQQQLLDMHAMDFLTQQVSLEAEVQMGTSLPVSSTATAPPTNSLRQQPTPVPALALTSPTSSLPARPLAELELGAQSSSSMSQSTVQDLASGVQNKPLSSLEPDSQNRSYRKSTSRLRLPALPPGTARSLLISARFPGPDASGALSGEADSTATGYKVPPGFVSTGDLEEDAQQLLELESEVWQPPASSVASICCMSV